MLLNRKQVQVGEAYSIKGDAQVLADLEETVQSIAEKKIRQAEADAQQIVALARQEAERAKQAILKEATEKAEETASALIGEAQAQHDAVLENARQEGFEAGFTQGYSDAVEKVETETVALLETAHTIVNGAYQAEQYVLSCFQQDAMALVRHVSEKIIQQELRQPELLVALIQGAIDKLYLTGRVKVVLGQSYLEMLRSFTPKTTEMMERLKRFEWTGDPMMSQHEIHILSADGAYSLGPDDQIATLLQPLENQFPLVEPPPLPEKPSVQAELIEAEDTLPLDPETPDYLETTDSGMAEAELVNSLETDPLTLLEEIVSLIPSPDDETESGTNMEDSPVIAVGDLPEMPAETTAPAVKSWSLEDLETVQEEYSEAASEPVPNETLPDAKPVEFPDLESLLTEFGPKIDQEPDEDLLS